MSNIKTDESKGAELSDAELQKVSGGTKVNENAKGPVTNSAHGTVANGLHTPVANVVHTGKS